MYVFPLPMYVFVPALNPFLISKWKSVGAAKWKYSMEDFESRKAAAVAATFFADEKV